MSEEHGVENVLEILKAAEVVAVTGVKIGKDGKVNLDDFKHLGELASNFGAIEAAIADADKVDEELKNLDEAEVIQLVGAAYSIARAVQEAAKAESA